MNIASAKLLQDSLQNAAENALRNRQLAQTGQLERQRLAVEQAFRNAMMKHYSQMEDRQQGFENRVEQTNAARELLAQQNTARQENQYAAAQKQGALKTIMSLNATGQLTPEGLKRVNQWLANDPDFGKTGIQLAAPANPDTSPQHMQTALAQGLALRQNVQSMYDTEKDPAKKAEYGKQLEDIDSYFQGKDAAKLNQTGTGAGPNGNGRDSSQVALPPLRRLRPRAAGGTEDPTQLPTGQQSTNPLPGAAPSATVAPAPTGPLQPDARDIQWLSASPTPQRIAKFESLYGQGSSSQFLDEKLPSQQ